MFSEIKKILTFLTPNWEKVMLEAKDMEARLQKGEDFLGRHRTEAHAFIKKWTQQINESIDVEALKTKLQEESLYQKWKDVPIDYPALVAVPEGFEIGNKDHMQALINDKLLWINNLLQKANIQFSTFDLNAALDDLAEISIIITDIPTDFDFEDEVAILKLRSGKLEQVQPKIVQLVARFLNKDLETMGVNEKLDKIREVADIMLTNDKDETATTDDDSETPPAENTEGENTPEDPAPSPGLLSTVRQKMPQIEEALEGEAIAGFNMSAAAKNTDDILASVEGKMPLIEQEFKNLQEDLSPTAIVSRTRTLYGHLNDVIEGSEEAKELFTMLKEPFLELDLEEPDWETAITQLQTLVKIPEDQVPANIRDLMALIKSKAEELLVLAGHLKINSEAFSPLKALFQQFRLEGITTDEAITRLESLADIPEDMAWDNPSHLITLMKNKTETLLNLAGHVRIEGIGAESSLTGIKTFLDKLLHIPEEAGLDSPTGILLLILDKIIAFMKESETTKDSWLLEQVEKIQMVVQFIHDKKPYIRLQETIPLHRQPPPAEPPARMINAQGEIPEALMTAHLSIAANK